MDAHFHELFPQLLRHSALDNHSIGSNSDNRNIDISTNGIKVVPIEQKIETAVQKSLAEWNECKPAHIEESMNYMERLRAYRDIMRYILYQDSSVVEDAIDSAQQVQTLKKKRKMHRRYQNIFASIESIEKLRENCLLGDRLQAFAAKYPPKLGVLSQKRSAADTETYKTFAFARINNAKADVEIVARDSHFRNIAEAVKAPTTIDEHDTVVWIEVLHPTREANKTQSFLMLGSQEVTCLTDRISCQLDQRFAAHKRTAKLIYFGKKFYVDSRAQAGTEIVDYSLPIREWIQRHSSRQKEYGRHSVLATNVATDHDARGLPAAMERTKMRDLLFHPHKDGVYIHQGECEHIIRIRNIRLLHEHDSDDRAIFPIRLRNPLQRPLRICLICKQYAAKHVCYGDKMSIVEPMFFCQRCFDAAHRDADSSELIYTDFESLPCIQD